MSSNGIFNIIFYFTKKYKFSILFFAVFAYLLRDILNLCVNNYIYKELINKLTYGDFSFQKDFYVFLGYILTINAGVLLSILTTKAEYNFKVKLKEDIKNHYFQKTLKHSVRFFNDNMAGTINSKIKTLSSDIVELLLLVIEMLSISITIIILIFIFAKTNYMLSLILLVWFIFYGGGSAIFMKKIGDKVKAKTKIENESYGKLTDSFTNILSVKIFSMEKYEKKELKKQSVDIKKENSNYFVFLTFQKIFDYFGIIAIILPVSYLTISMKIENKINIGELVFIFSVFGSIVGWLRYLARGFIRISECYGSISESLNVINVIPDIKDIDGSKNVILKTSPKIDFKNVLFKYKENLPIVFENFNLIIQPKQKVGIVGYTGSGKSTFVNLLLRFYELNGGNIFLDNYDIKSDFTQLSLRKNISYIPQEPILFHRSIKENILYGNLKITDEELIEAAKKAYCYDFIMELEKGFDTLVGDRGVKLSGGQKQRIAIARAIIKNSNILILDEATSALDSITENYIQKALNNLMENKTVIAIAHRLSTLNNMDRIIVLDKGKIAEDGTKDELLNIKDGLFAKMWNMQKNGVLSIE